MATVVVKMMPSIPMVNRSPPLNFAGQVSTTMAERQHQQQYQEQVGKGQVGGENCNPVTRAERSEKFFNQWSKCGTMRCLTGLLKDVYLLCKASAFCMKVNQIVYGAQNGFTMTR
jgi:hypothetical protein